MNRKKFIVITATVSGAFFYESNARNLSFRGANFMALFLEDEIQNNELVKLYNQQLALKLSSIDLLKENKGLDNLIFLDSKYKLEKWSPKQIKDDLLKQEPFNSTNTPKVNDVRLVYQKYYQGQPVKSSLDNVIEAGNVFFTAASLPVTFYAGIMCLTTGVACLPFLAIALPSTIFGFGSLIKTDLDKNKLSSVSAYKGSLLGQTVIPAYNEQLNFDLGRDFKRNSKLSLTNNVNLDKLAIDGKLKATIKSMLKANNERELKPILQKYINEIGDHIETNIKEYIEATRKDDQKQVVESQNKAYFYQSLNSFLSNIVGENVHDPKLAAVLNVAISAGIQYVAFGLTPIGWVAIGISLMTALMSSGRDAFKDAVFEALSNLHKQLNYILEKLDVIYNNQIIIIKQLNQILDEIVVARKINVKKLEDISRQSVRLYSYSNNVDYARLDGSYEKILTSLKTLVYNGKDFSKSVFFINDLLNYLVVDTKSPTYTSYNLTDQVINGALLKEKIFNPHSAIVTKPLYSISLHDSIGCASACASFSSTGYGIFSRDTHHLPKCFLAISDIFNWIFYSNLTIKEVEPFIAQMEETIKDNSVYLKKFADLSIIQDKLNGFIRACSSFITVLYSKMYEKHQIEFVNNNQALTSIGITQLNSNWYINSLQLSSEPSQILEEIERQFPESINFFVNDRKATITISKGYSGRMDRGYYIIPLHIPNADMVASMAGRKWKQGVKLRDGDISYRVSFLSLDVFDQNGEQRKIDFEISLTKQIFITDAYPTVAANFNLAVPVKKVEIQYDFGNWKATIKEKLETSFQRKIDDIIPTYSSLNTMHDFLVLLNKDWAKAKKNRFIFDISDLISSQSLIDGFGISTYFLTKLNEYIYAKKPNFYIIDYSQEVFTTDDILSTLNFYALASFEKEERKLLETIIKGENDPIFTSLDNDINPYMIVLHDGSAKRLYCKFWVDLMIIILKRKILLSKTYVESIAKQFSKDDYDPITVDCFNKINFIKEAYGIS